MRIVTGILAMGIGATLLGGCSQHASAFLSGMAQGASSAATMYSRPVQPTARTYNSCVTVARSPGDTAVRC